MFALNGTAAIFSVLRSCKFVKYYKRIIMNVMRGTMFINSIKINPVRSRFTTHPDSNEPIRYRNITLSTHLFITDSLKCLTGVQGCAIGSKFNRSMVLGVYFHISCVWKYENRLR